MGSATTLSLSAQQSIDANTSDLKLASSGNANLTAISHLDLSGSSASLATTEGELSIVSATGSIELKGDGSSLKVDADSTLSSKKSVSVSGSGVKLASTQDDTFITSSRNL